MMWPAGPINLATASPILSNRYHHSVEAVQYTLWSITPCISSPILYEKVMYLRILPKLH